MATPAQCFYCFEALAASFDKKEPPKLERVEQLWHAYEQSKLNTTSASENSHNTLLPNPSISKLQNSATPTSQSSVSTTPSSLSVNSSTSALTTPSSVASDSTTSLYSGTQARSRKNEQFPLFVTWNTISRNGNTSLRGCIGTFQEQELEYGLKTYAITS